VGIVENLADALPHSSRSFRLGQPDVSQGVADMAGANLIDPQFSKPWEGIGFEARKPLRLVLGVASPLLPFRMIGLRRLLERRDFASRALCLERIDARAQLLAKLSGFVARLSQRNIFERTEPVVAAPAIRLQPRYPALGPSGPDFKNKSVAVTVASRLRKIANLEWIELSHASRLSGLTPHLSPHF
jgi:hypothetical protein